MSVVRLLAPLNPASAVDARAREAYLARLAPSSRRTMARSLETAARALDYTSADAVPWCALTAGHVAAIRAALAAHQSPASVNRILAAVRGVLRAAWRQGTISADELARACDVPGVTDDRAAAGRVLSRGEILALFDAARSRHPCVSRRDLALLSVLYGGGLRRAEAAALRWIDVDGRRLTVTGKGTRVRAVYLPAAGARYLERWRQISSDGAVFCALSARGKPAQPPAPLSPRGVYAILRRLAELGRVAPLGPHDLRRTFATVLISAGADYRAVQALMGHRSIETTAAYDRRGEDAARGASDLLHLPEDPDDD